MNNPDRSTSRLTPLCVALLFLLHSGLGAQIAPPTPPADSSGTPSTANPVITLSPFTVTTDTEKGYLATQTLSGTRLNSSLRDVGAAMTIFTERLLDDLAASSVADLLAFAPNTSAYLGEVLDTTGHGNAFLTTQSPQYVTRGGKTALISQNFFGTPAVPPDRYNAESLTFTRGPNSILFGLGNAAGAFTSTTKRANFRNAYQLELRGDNNGGLRTTVDINRVIVPKRLALRYAGLIENSEGFLDPSSGEQRRHFFTVQYTPFATTSLRANYEFGSIYTMVTRPWPAYDGVTPWIDAGMPLLATAGSGRTPVPGTQLAYAGNVNQPGASLLVTDRSRGGTVVPPMYWGAQGRSATPTFPKYPVLSVFRSLMNSAIFPTTANVLGDGNTRDVDFHTFTATWEQQIGNNFFLEAAFNRSLSDALLNNTLGGQFEVIYADVNRQLPNGAPNPNVGMLYVDSNTNVLPNKNIITNGRLMLSYDLDFAKYWPRAGVWLGRHRAAAFTEDGVTNTWGSQNPAYNGTPLPGAQPGLLDATNRVNFRYYLDPAKGATTAGFNTVSRYPLVFSGSPIPARDPSGVTPILAAVSAASQETRVITRAFATQSKFWKDRLVVTYGIRKDTQINYQGSSTDFNPWKDGSGIFPNPRNFGAKEYFAKSRTQGDGQTHTRGVVLHALPWLSLFANQSNNFQPNSSRRGPDSKLLANEEGDGQDYGLKFSLLDGRIFADILYYKNFARNRADGAVVNGLHGNFQADTNPIWATIAAVESDNKYLVEPYSFLTGFWSDVQTGYSDGYESSVTANLTSAWRLTLNGSKRGPGKTIERGAATRAYLAKYFPIWKANAKWMSAPLVSGSFPGTIADAVARLEKTLANFDALAELPTDGLYSPTWSANLITSYDFAARSRLQGFSVGASANLRGRTIMGFAENAGNVLDPKRPYYAKEYLTTGAWITYRRKLFQKVPWRLQLNVRNVLDDDKIFPHRAVDTRDGTGRPTVVIYRLNEPRTFVLTSTFTF